MDRQLIDIDAKQFKRQFRVWQLERIRAGAPASQLWCGSVLGMSQSAISQYLNGRIPMNLDAASKFASLMGRKVSELSLSISREAPTMPAAVSGSAVIVPRKRPIPRRGTASHAYRSIDGPGLNPGRLNNAGTRNHWEIALH